MTDTSPVALITGARKGIGRFLAEHLLGQGYRVVGCSRKTPNWEAEHFTFIPADVTDETQVKALLRQINRAHKRLDVVINNAGAASMNHALLTPGDTLDRLMGTNVRGTFLVTREAAKLMRKRTYGRIVNMSSVAVPLRLEGQAAYVASKGAVEHLSQVMAREVAELGITINVVGATPIATDMLRGVPQATLDRLVQTLPISRLGTFEDVANAVDFFISPASDAITGQILYLGGVPN